MPLPDGAGIICDSNVVRVIVLSGENSDKAWENMLKQSGREKETRLPVSGLGDKAYALNLQPRKENEYPTSLIVVSSGVYTAAVSVRAKQGEPAESAQPEAVELSKIVVSKLH